MTVQYHFDEIVFYHLFFVLIKIRLKGVELDYSTIKMSFYVFDPLDVGHWAA